MVRVNTKGRTVGPLRPAGKVRIGEEVYGAASEGQWIDADTDVVVIGSETSGLLVKEADGADVTDRAPAPDIDPQRTEDHSPMAHFPRSPVERVNAPAWGAGLWTLLGGAVAWLRFGPGPELLLLPVAGFVTGAIFAYFVRGTRDLVMPNRDHRPAAKFLSIAIGVGGAAGVAVTAALGMGAVGMSFGLLVGVLATAIVTSPFLGAA